MKTEAVNREISISDQLSTDLSQIIDKKHKEFLRVINSKLITLFWEIGKELNQCLNRNGKAKYTKYGLRKISAQLIANYGPWFAEKKLKRMSQFAEKIPDFSYVAEIASFVTWEHFLLLLPIRDLESMLFYIRITVEQGLTVNDLRKQMSANLFEQSKAFKVSKEKDDAPTKELKNRQYLQKLRIGFRHTSRTNPVMKNVFKEPLLSSFRQLMEPSKQPEMLFKKNKKINSFKGEFFEILSKHIEKYRYQQNNWLNGNLNLFFWEIGRQINQETLLNDKTLHLESVIRKVSQQLGKKRSQTFSKKQLQEMMKFAEQFKDLSTVLRFAYLLSWKHILALLSLNEIEAKLFYARLTAVQGLSVTDLQKQIAMNVYEQTSGAKEREQAMVIQLQESIKTSIRNKKGSTIAIDTIFIDDINNNFVNRNIFRNSYLPLLVLSEAKI